MVEVDKELVKAIIKEMADDYKENPFETYQQQQQRQLLKLADGLNKLSDDFVAGLTAIYDKLDSIDLGDEQRPELPNVAEIGLRLQAKSNEIEDKVETIKQLQDYAGITDEGLAYLCKAAFLLLHEQDLERAPKAFNALILLNSDVALFWLGYGRALSFANRKTEAFDAYRMAAYLDPLDPNGYVLAIDMASELGRKDLAEEIIQQGQEEIANAGDLQKISELRETIDLMSSYVSEIK